MTDLNTLKQLRKETKISFSQCKSALEESGGDIEKARIILKQNSGSIAAKKMSRDLGAGVIESYIHAGGQTGCLVELFCESDFVSSNELFSQLAKDLALHITAMKPKYTSRDSIPKKELEEISDEIKSEIDKSKPTKVKKEIFEGKLESVLSEMVLLEQSFVKDDETTIQEMIDTAISTLGERVEIGRFVIYQV